MHIVACLDINGFYFVSIYDMTYRKKVTHKIFIKQSIFEPVHIHRIQIEAICDRKDNENASFYNDIDDF